MDLIILIPVLILGVILKNSSIGKMLIFFAFIIIMCELFGSYIPFSDMISKLIKFGSVSIIIYMGASFIFMPGKK